MFTDRVYNYIKYNYHNVNMTMKFFLDIKYDLNRLFREYITVIPVVFYVNTRFY